MIQQQNQLASLKEIISRNEATAHDEFLTFLRFASVSTDPAYKEDLLACLSWLKQYVSKMGFTVETWDTSGHPVLFATYLKAGPKKPTLLIYNHYDVQPVDPLS